MFSPLSGFLRPLEAHFNGSSAVPRRALRRSGVVVAVVALLGIPLVLMGGAAHAGSCAVAGHKSWVANSPDNNWFNPANWSPAGVPTATTEVCIGDQPTGGAVRIATGGSAAAKAVESHYPVEIDGGSTLTLAAASDFVSDLTLTSGTLAGAGSPTVSGKLSWDGDSSMTGTGTTTIATGGSLRIDDDFEGGTRHLVGGRKLTIASGASGTWAGAPDIELEGGAVFTVAGSLDVQNNRQMFQFDASTAAIKVASGGTLTKTSSEQTTIGPILENDGTATVSDGRLQLNNGTGAGSDAGLWSPAAGAGVTFAGGIRKLTTGATLGGGGVNRLTGGELSAIGASSVASGATLAMSGGALRGASTVAVNGTLAWDGPAPMLDTGTTQIASGGLLRVDDAASEGERLIGASRKVTIDSGATATWAGASDLNMDNASVLTVNGAFNVTNNRVLGSYGGATGPLVKVPLGGILKKTAGAGGTRIDPPVDNDGTVQGNAGTLSLNGGSGVGSHTGAWVTGLSGATVALDGGIHNVSGTPHISGPGAVKLASDVNVQSGTLTVDLASRLALSAGLLRGPGALLVKGTLAWDGNSTMQDSGVTTIASGGKLLISDDASTGTRSLSAARKIALNAGATGTWSGSDAISMSDTSLLEIGGTFTNTNDRPVYNFGGSPLLHVLTGGTFKKQTAVGQTDVGVAFENDGTAQASAGTISFQNGSGAGSDSGKWITSVAGARLRLDAGTHNIAAISSLSGPGRLVFAADVNQTGAATVPSGATLAVSGGTLRGPGATTVAAGGTLRWDGDSTMTSAGTAAANMTVNGNLVINDGAGDGTRHLAGGRKITLGSTGSGTWSGADDLVVSDTSSLTVNGPFTVANNRSLYTFGGTPKLTVGATGTLQKSLRGTTAIGIPVTNSGTTTIARGTLRFTVAPTNYNATTRALSGGIWTASAGGVFQIDGMDAVTNGATVKLIGPTSRFSDGTQDGFRNLVTNSKVLELRQGRNLAVPGNLTNTGTLAMDANTKVTAAGKFTMGTAGKLAVTIAGTGTTPGVDFSQVEAGNGAALNGTLDVATTTQPPAGTALPIITLTGGTRTGTFTTTTGTANYTVNYNPTDVTLVSAPPA